MPRPPRHTGHDDLTCRRRARPGGPV